MADMTPTFLLEEDEEPMATEPIFLLSDESEYSTPNAAPELHNESIYPDLINQLIVSQLEELSNLGTKTVFYPPTPKTSMISDDEEQSNLTPIIGNPEQYTSQIPQRRNHPIQLCQHVQPITDTPEPPLSEDQGPKNIFPPYELRNPSSSTLFNNPSNISTVANGLQNLTLHPHPQRNEWLTGCLICEIPYEQVIEETVAEYFNRRAQPGETVRERQIKRNAFIYGLQCGIFNSLPPGVSQAAVIDGPIYSVNYGGQNSGIKGIRVALVRRFN